MAEGSGSTAIIGVIIGAIIVIAVGFFLISGNPFGGTKEVDIKVDPPKVDGTKQK